MKLLIVIILIFMVIKLKLFFVLFECFLLYFEACLFVLILLINQTLVENLLKHEPLLDKMNDQGKLTWVLSSPWRTVFIAVWLALESKKPTQEYGWVLDEMEPDVSCYPRFYDE